MSFCTGSNSLVRFFKALGDETRLTIVSCLMVREICACELPSFTGKDQSTVSRHLKVLTEAGILKSRKEGRWIHHSIKDDDTLKLLRSMGIEENPEARKDIDNGTEKRNAEHKDADPVHKGSQDDQHGLHDKYDPPPGQSGPQKQMPNKITAGMPSPYTSLHSSTTLSTENW